MNQALIAWSFRQITVGSPPNLTNNKRINTFITHWLLVVLPPIPTDPIHRRSFLIYVRLDNTIVQVLSGSARTLDPTSKNYAPELSTFGTIIEVNRSEVQWKSLSLEKLPSWSQLISAPGKYEVSGRALKVWTLCTNCRGSRYREQRTSDRVFTLTEL